MLTPTSPNPSGEVPRHQVRQVDGRRALLQRLLGHRRRKWVVLLACLALPPLLQGCALIEILGEAIGAGIQQACELPELTVTRTDDVSDGFCTAEDCSLREAIIAANACPGRQMIVLPTDTYSVTESRSLEISDDLDIRGGGSTVSGLTNRLAIDDSLTSVEISSLTFTGMSYPIDNAGLLTLSNVVFTNNDTSFAIVYNRGRLTLVNSTFTGNIAESLIVNSGTLAFQGGEVATNTTHGNVPRSYHSGGPLSPLVWNSGVMTLHAVEFAGNLRIQFYCPDGPGSREAPLIYNSHSGRLTAEDIVLRGIAPTASMPACAAPIDVGIDNDGESRVIRSTLTGWEERAVYNDSAGQLEILDSWLMDNPGEALYNIGTATISQSTVSGNGLFLRHSIFPSPCGAIVNRGSLTIENSTISGNSDIGSSGSPAFENSTIIGASGLPCEAIANEGDLTLSFVTVVYNRLTGVGTHGGSGALHTSLRSSIVVGNGLQNCIGLRNESAGHNLFGDSTCAAEADLGDQVLMPLEDPLLGPLADNGGPTLTHELLLGSPAISRGGPLCPSTDQRYVPRHRFDPSGPPGECDVGAYESDLGFASAALVAATPEVETPIAIPTPTATQPPSTPTLAATSPAATLPPTAPAQPSATPVPPKPTSTSKPTDTPKPSPPAAPSGLQITDRKCTGLEFSFKLGWKDNSKDELGFRIYRDGKLLATLPADSLNYLEQPPDYGAHSYAVVAYNAAGESKAATVADGGCVY